MTNNARWDHLRDEAQTRLQAEGNGHLAPALEELVDALKSARSLRRLAEQEPTSTLKSGRVLANPLFVEADREARRAAGLIRLLGLQQPQSAALMGSMGLGALDELDLETQFDPGPRDRRAHTSRTHRKPARGPARSKRTAAQMNRRLHTEEGKVKMPSEYQHERLQEALIAGGYADADAKVAAASASGGLGARTTVSLITKIDPQAAQIAEDILGDDQGQQTPAIAQTPEQNKRPPKDGLTRASARRSALARSAGSSNANPSNPRSPRRGRREGAREPCARNP
jgi:hypothetical protein